MRQKKVKDLQLFSLYVWRGLLLINLINEFENEYIKEMTENINLYTNHLLPEDTKRTLAEGYPGYSLLLYNLSLYNHEKKWKYINHNMIKAIESIDISDNTSSLWTGPTSFSISLYLWSHYIPEYTDTLIKINKRLFEQVNHDINTLSKRINKSEIIYTDYDLIYGLSGLVRYLLLFQQDKKACDLVIKSVEILIYLIEEPKKLRIIDSKNPHTKMYRDGYIDTGVSHGALGIVSVLSICISSNVFKNHDQLNKKTIDTIKKFVYKLLLFKKYTKNFWYIPNYIGYMNYEKQVVNNEHQEPLSYMWCYGLTGMTRSLILFAEATDDSEFKEEVISNYSNALDYYIMLESIHKSNTTFCHGIAGILYESNLIYIDTNDQRYYNHCKSLLNLLNENKGKDPKYPFYDEVLSNQHYINKAGLLNGSIGVYLVLLSIVTGKPFEGDFIFLKR